MSVKELKFRSEKSPLTFEAPAQKSGKNSSHLAGFLTATVVLAACFCVPLYKLLRLSLSDDLYSAIPLVPLVSLYLVWLKRDSLPRSFGIAIKPAVVLGMAGALSVTASWLIPSGSSEEIGSDLPLNILGFLLIFVGICFLFLGELLVRAVTFPLALLIFTVPFPDVLRDKIESFLQYGSAVCAGAFFHLSGTPYMRDGLNFHLPGCLLHVAPECSGIHSTLVLAITSLIGAWLFLCSPWKRTALVLIVIPLALIRNGFRIFVIGRLCVAYGPQMLASPIHRHGGPLFFALSLVPLFLFLFLLRKTEQTKPSIKKIV
ncbi:MAG TPA: archaeosortase/exosortase family protein [Pseudomonadales bacterium]|nr:archaeosortase/exosortase family protein [Pseudomonadales bacterium]